MMQISLHIGAHCTDEDQIMKCLAANRKALATRGIFVPVPARYRPVMRETLQILKNEVASKEIQEVILDAVLDEDEAQRVVLSHDSFISVPGMAVGENKLYPIASAKAPRLRNLFADNEVHFSLALRNPATFVPSVFERAKEDDFSAFIAGTDPMTLRWSDLVIRIRQAVPDASLTVWCNEDTPLIWPEVLRAVTGVGEDFVLDGEHDFLRNLMSRNGVERLESYLEAHPPANVAQRRKVVAAFLDKFAGDDALEQEIDLPGWTAPYIDTLTALYDEDVANIAAMQGVTFIEP